MTTDTNPEKIEELLTRSIDTIYPSKEALKTVLLSGKQLRIYVGIDPTATYVHLGHSTNYILLRRLHELGHKIIVLIGDFTAMIGDPTDKTAARSKLTREEVENNFKTFKKQIGKILNFSSWKNPIEFKFNADWLAKLSFSDVIELSSHFTVQQMIERDTFQKRLKDNKPLYVHEFFYPLMQGYDSVALKADVEIGGTDQTFNMLAGRTLARAYQKRDKFVITTTLLENPVTGEKLMSKSLGTGIGLDENPQDMYGKVMRLPDEALIQCFIDCTTLPMSEIESLKTLAAENPRDLKMRLGREIVSMYHSKSAAEKAEANFVSTFQKKEIPDDVEEIKMESGEKLVDLLVRAKVIESKSEFRRLVEQGGLHKLTGTDTNEKGDGQKVEDQFAAAEQGTYKIGKRRFIKIK